MLYIGASDPNWFHFAGGTLAEKSLRTFEYFTNRPRSDIKKIVDWGCGCARVSRHYFDLCNAQIIGLDIDEKMINWCKSELPDGQWITSSPHPPSHLPDNSADLIIGHSVFTHLDEFTQFQWLKELARLVKPDGLGMVTVLGVYGALLEPPLTVEEEETLQENGFLEPNIEKIETNKQIILSESDKEYRTYHKGVFHMPDYIVSQWSNFFEIIAIIEGFADHQALVVLKKKD